MRASLRSHRRTFSRRHSPSSGVICWQFMRSNRRTGGKEARATPGSGWVRAVCAAGAVIAFAGGAAAQTPGAYRIDPRASHIEIHVFRTGLLGGLGDNHIIVLERFSGTANASAGKSWQIQVTGDAASLKVVDPGASESTRQRIEEKMLGPSQMDAAHYPAIELQSRSAAPGDAKDSWRLLADVTAHGVTRQVDFPLTWSESPGQIHVHGKQTLRLRDFGIEPIRLGLGTVKVKNEFELVYDLVLKRQ